MLYILGRDERDRENSTFVLRYAPCYHGNYNIIISIINFTKTTQFVADFGHESHEIRWLLGVLQNEEAEPKKFTGGDGISPDISQQKVYNKVELSQMIMNELFVKETTTQMDGRTNNGRTKSISQPQ